MRSLRARVLFALLVVVGSFGVALGLNALELARIGRSLDLVNDVYLPLAGTSSRMGAAVERGDLAPLLADAREILAGARTEEPEERAALNAAQRQVAEVETAWSERAAVMVERLGRHVARPRIAWGLTIAFAQA